MRSLVLLAFSLLASLLCAAQDPAEGPRVKIYRGQDNSVTTFVKPEEFRGGNGNSGQILDGEVFIATYHGGRILVAACLNPMPAKCSKLDHGPLNLSAGPEALVDLIKNNVPNSYGSILWYKQSTNEGKIINILPAVGNDLWTCNRIAVVRYNKAIDDAQNIVEANNREYQEISFQSGDMVVFYTSKIKRNVVPHNNFTEFTVAMNYLVPAQFTGADGFHGLRVANLRDQAGVVDYGLLFVRDMVVKQRVDLQIASYNYADYEGSLIKGGYVELENRVFIHRPNVDHVFLTNLQEIFDGTPKDYGITRQMTAANFVDKVLELDAMGVNGMTMFFNKTTGVVTRYRFTGPHGEFKNKPAVSDKRQDQDVRIDERIRFMDDLNLEVEEFYPTISLFRYDQEEGGIRSIPAVTDEDAATDEGLSKQIYKIQEGDFFVAFNKKAVQTASELLLFFMVEEVDVKGDLLEQTKQMAGAFGRGILDNDQVYEDAVMGFFQ